MVYCLLAALLYTAEFQSPNTEFISEYECGPDFVQLLSTQLKSREAAKQAIIFACGASTVRTFRSRILSCKFPEITTARLDGATRIDKGFKEDKKLAREIIREQHFPRRCCSNPDCSEQEKQAWSFHLCPCKNAYFCGKSCQVSDWPMHKLSCSERKSKGKK